MPAQSTWFHRLKDIARRVSALEGVERFTRQEFEILLGVRKQRATELMAQWGGEQIVGAWTIEREKLLRALKAVEKDRGFRAFEENQQRVAQKLQEDQRNQRWRAVEIAVPEDAERITLASLPASIHVGPGGVRIGCADFQELLTQLWQLSQACGNDEAAFLALLDARDSHAVPPSSCDHENGLHVELEVSPPELPAAIAAGA